LTRSMCQGQEEERLAEMTQAFVARVWKPR